jgi:glycine reductase complex component B subunit gamma
MASMRDVVSRNETVVRDAGVRGVRVVHYLNQFFGGIGGEEHADHPVAVRSGPIGPGRALAREWQNVAEIVATVIAGDNYVATFSDEAETAIGRALETHRPDVLVAGPAFNAGRYGMGCGAACRVATRLGIPSVTAMFPANPALAMEQNRKLLVLPTAEMAIDMPRAAKALARIALKLGRGERLGTAAEEGFLPRGIRADVMHEDTGADRAIALLKRKLAGEPYRSELAIEVFDAVPPAPPITHLAGARIALVTTGGIVPRGNPDRMREYNSVTWRAYSIAGLDDLTALAWEPIHGGYDSTWAREDPDRVVPVDALRALERAGKFGALDDRLYVTVGVGTSVGNARRFGEEIARDLHDRDVQGVILTAT